MTTFANFSRTLKTTLGTSARLAALLALSTGAISATAHADEEPGYARTQQVTLAGLNLSTAEGQQLAQARLLGAAHALCSQVADDLDLSHHANFIKCVDSAMEKANQRLQAVLNNQSAARVARADVK